MSSDSSWSISTLDNAADFINGDRGKNYPSSSDYVASGIPFVSASDLDGRRIDLSGATFISQGAYDRLGNGKIEQGDILFCLRGSLGKIGLAKGIQKGAIASSLVIIRPKQNVSRDFLYYILSGSTGKTIARELDNGSVQGNLSVRELKQVEIDLPSPQEQKAIAHILGTLDDKIELNRKTNETLEAMAKALFKSWFVDFDPVRAKAEGRSTGLPAEISDLFPDSFEDSELGEIPSGWEVGGLEEFLVLQRGFDLPASQRIKGAYPVVAASGVSGTHNEPMAFAPGVVTGRSGVLGKVFYIQTDFFPLNTTLWAKEFRLATPIYGYFLLCDIDFAVFNAGSAVPTLNRNHLGSLRFPLPPKALVVSFTDVAVDLMKKKEGIVAETSNLSATRDALLPKLISGEIRIPDAEKMLEEVGV